MKPPPFEYHRVDSVDEAAALLADYGDEAKILAGGQSLIPLLAVRLARPEHVVDINRVAELSALEHNEGLRLGSVVRQRTTERSDVARAANPLLVEALGFIGHVAIRNRGTIAGSIAHADPAAEMPTVLRCLDGDVIARSARGRRIIPAADFFVGFLSTTLEPDELVEAVRFPAWVDGSGWSFREFSRRSGDFAIAGAAVVVTLTNDGTIARARIALSGMDATPIRAMEVENALVGQAPGPELWASAANDAVASLDPPSDIHGSAAYRRHLAAALLRHALTEAEQRAAA